MPEYSEIDQQHLDYCKRAKEVLTSLMDRALADLDSTALEKGVHVLEMTKIWKKFKAIELEIEIENNPPNLLPGRKHKFGAN